MEAAQVAGQVAAAAAVAAAAVGVVGGDSGVDEGDQESSDSFMSSISVGIAQQAAAQQQHQHAGAVSNNADVMPDQAQPGPASAEEEEHLSEPPQQEVHRFPAPLPTAQISPPNSTVSSISDSMPATPEPAPGPSSSLSSNQHHQPLMVNGLLQPPHLGGAATEDGYLGDCSSDGGNEKNFPMPPEKLERLLCSAHRSRGASSEGPEPDTGDPPIGRMQQEPGYFAYQRIGSGGVSGGPSGSGASVGGSYTGGSCGGGGPIRRSSESRKMRSHHVIRHRIHPAGGSGGSWAHLKSDLASRKLRIAANVNNAENVERLMAAGANPNDVDDHKRSPLHFAAAKVILEIS